MCIGRVDAVGTRMGECSMLRQDRMSSSSMVRSNANAANDRGLTARTTVPRIKLTWFEASGGGENFYGSR